MSEAALRIAQENLKGCLPTGAEISLVLNDMVDYVKVCPSPVGARLSCQPLAD